MGDFKLKNYHLLNTPSSEYDIDLNMPSKNTSTVVNRSKSRITDKKTNKTLIVNFNSNIQLESYPFKSICLNDPCGAGVACFPKKNKEFICICSDGTHIQPGNLCPYIKPVNVTPPAVSMSQSNEHKNILLQGLLLSSFVIIALSILSVIAYWKRREVKRLLKNKRNQKIEYDESMIKVNSFYSANLANNPNYCSGSSLDMLQIGSLMVPLIPKEHIIFDGEIGQGQFGIVYKGELMEPINTRSSAKSLEILQEKGFPGNKQTVAVKVLKGKSCSNGEIDFQREVEVASMFKHENILSLIGIVSNADVGRAPWMIFEFMPHGDLAGFLRSFSKTFYVHDSAIDPMSKENLMKISIDIACGMKYLASQHFVHRDLACRNCLVGENLTVKISDFGMSRDVYTCDYYKAGRNGAALPIRWMSPESISYGKFTLESDVWSYGITLWEVYSFAKLPYYGNSNEEVIKRITGGIVLSAPETSPPAIMHVMELCWKAAQQRPNFSHIVPYLKAAMGNPSAIQFLNPPRNAGDLTIYTQLALHDPPLDADSYLLPRSSTSEYLTVLNSSPI